MECLIHAQYFLFLKIRNWIQLHTKEATNISAPTTEQHVQLSLSLTFMACTHWTHSYLRGGEGGASVPMIDRQAKPCHTHFVSLLSHRLSFVQTGPSFAASVFVSRTIFTGTTCSGPAGQNRLLPLLRVFMTCAHTHAHQGRAAHTQTRATTILQRTGSRGGNAAYFAAN